MRFPSTSASVSTGSRVVPARSLTITRSEPSSALSSEDLPTLGRPRIAIPRIAILGRPNVGKSSLLNALLGSERVIVSERAGTTRDPVDTEAEVEGKRIVLVDTAGLRRRGKVAGTVGYYAQLRAERTAERADAAIVVCDASEGLTAEDLRVGELAMRSGCATVLALNKWDLVRAVPAGEAEGNPFHAGDID